MRAWRGSTPLPLGPVRRQAVPAAPALRPGCLVSREQLPEEICGAGPPNSGRKVLPTYVYALRQALDAEGSGPARSLIRGEPGGYRLVTGEVQLDSTDLAEHGDAARRAKASGDPATAVERLPAVLALFEGGPPAGLSGPFADVERWPCAARRWPLTALTRAVTEGAVPSAYAASPAAGSMFWLAWNRFLGSYLRLTSARRS
ncbi:hypothetical protein [Streptomyces sp. NPDC058695]|uniref:AfsR/SARP family transcriptional regulator n=1 Tax=Streptomyces sp. NPDC058695 TaxID=3346604 RepID=UPI0036512D03